MKRNRKIAVSCLLALAMVCSMTGCTTYNNFKAAFSYLKVMFTPTAGSSFGLCAWIITLAVGIIASTPLLCTAWERLKEKIPLAYAEVFLCLAALILSCAGLVTDSYNPFLYFRF